MFAYFNNRLYQQPYFITFVKVLCSSITFKLYSIFKKIKQNAD